MESPREYQHPLIIRFTHWINFLVLGIMVTSGFKIYNASPLFDFTFPTPFLLGGWLAGARQWHFFGMWLFFINGGIYLLYNIFSSHGRATTLFSKSDLNDVVPMIQYYLRFRKEHPLQAKYNSLQKLAYTIVPVLGLGGILSGIAIYWPVQFQTVTLLFGGYDTARVWHFIIMTLLCLFIFVHLIMVAFAGWDNFFSMITGWKRRENSN